MSSSGDSLSNSPSEGEYTLPPDERSDGDTMSPILDVSQWKPEPPAGLQFLSLLPVSQGYELSPSTQHEHIGKMTVAQRHKNQRRKDFLTGKTVGRNITDEKRLRSAVYSGNYSLVEELLKSGIEPCCVDEKKRSPLHIAAAQGSKKIVELLLDQGADPNQKDIIGNTALHLAACTNHIPVVTLLLKAGTDVNAMDNEGRTPLHLARSHLRIMQTDHAEPSEERKLQVENILLMMKEYLSRSGQVDGVQELNRFTDQLQETVTMEELDNLSGLLADFTNLQIQKREESMRLDASS